VPSPVLIPGQSRSECNKNKRNGETPEGYLLDLHSGVSPNYKIGFNQFPNLSLPSGSQFDRSETKLEVLPLAFPCLGFLLKAVAGRP